MAIKTFEVAFTRIYSIDLDEKATDDFVIKYARSKFNNDMEFGLIDALEDNFSAEIIEIYD